MIKEYFRNGINLGGWLSQMDCTAKPPHTDAEKTDHILTFITEDNIRQIASWGMDHVRLPLDFHLLEAGCENPSVQKTAMDQLDQMILWCLRYHLNLVLDLHNCDGNIYGEMNRLIPLFTDSEKKEAFIKIWEQLTLHFKNISSPVIMFELLNEVSDASGYEWFRLCHDTIDRIRRIDPKRIILVGSNNANSVFSLKEIPVFPEDEIYYNFHFYDPQVFTHQRAHFSEEMMKFNKQISYPGNIPDFTNFLMQNKKYLPKYKDVLLETEVNRQTMKHLLKNAADFVHYSGKELYCGEFGVINSACPEDAAAWILDCAGYLDTLGIGHALWNYKDCDFGLLDFSNNIISPRLVDTIF